MSKSKREANRVEIVEEGRKGWIWVLYAKGKASARGVESYRRARDARRGWVRHEDATLGEVFTIYMPED